MQAAKYLGVPVWDLVERPRFWTDYALTVMGIEHGAQEEIRRRHAQR